MPNFSESSRPRVIVTTDGEVDDRCSMNRFLLYTNDWDTEGLIYCSSRFHWKGHDWAGEDWIDDQIDTYERVYDNLVEHDSDYPDPDSLRKRVYVGNIDDVGEMETDTPGSDRIVDVLLDDKPGPVYLQCWGGTNTVARALWKIENEYPDRMEDVSDKAVIYIILNQDRTLREYIQPNWPDIQVLNSFKQFRVFAYRWDDLIPDREVRQFLESEWMREHIVSGHGPLCSAYPTAEIDADDLNPGLRRRYEEKGEYFLSEGDTPAYFHQIRVGLGSLEHPSYGGWGGRFELEPGSKNVWIGAEDDGDLYKPIWRWVPDIQRDWAARADWCVSSFGQANHPPKVAVDGDVGLDIIRYSVEPGAEVTLDAADSTDPDGDTLSFRWWNYRDAENTRWDLETVAIRDPESATTVVEVPGDTRREHHVVLDVTDDGDPPLTRHRRVILDSRE